MKRIRAKIIVFVAMLFLSMFAVVNVSAVGPNYMGFSVTPKDVTVGDSFTTIVWVNVGRQIDTASVDNLTFLPAGVLNYTSTAQGNLFAGMTAWIIPETGGHINNASGYANPITWAYTTPVNNTNRTLATITWHAYGCGSATTTISLGGTASGGLDPGTTKLTGVVHVHPMVVTSFTATMYNSTQINLTWTKHTGDTRTLIRYRVDHAPTSVTDGTLLYNNTGSSTLQTGLTPGDHVYYSAWGYYTAGNLYSLTYGSDDAYTNQPPVLGTPTPANGATGQATSLTWSIPISDPEGDLFSYWITCSNGQTISSVSSINGTKHIAVTGLDFLTTYTMYVNVTDGHSDVNDTFNFTTAANQAPEVPDGGSPGHPQDVTPVNTAPDVPINIGFLRVRVTDPDAQTMNVTFYWGNGSVMGTVVNTPSGSTAAMDILLLNYSTTYYWYVNITDSEGATTRGPSTGNWSYTTEELLTGGQGTVISIHNVYVTVIDDSTNLPIANAHCKVQTSSQMKLSHLFGEGNTDQYGAWSTELKDGYTYQLTVVAHGYTNYSVSFSIEHQNVNILVKMKPMVGAAGLTSASGGLTTTGFIALGIGIFALIGIVLILLGKKK